MLDPRLRGDRVLAATPNPKRPQHCAVFVLHLHGTCLGITSISGTSNFVCIFTGSIRTKGREKIWEQIAVDIVNESKKFSGHSYMGRIARSSLR